MSSRLGSRVHRAGAVGQGQDYVPVPGVLCSAGDSDGAGLWVLLPEPEVPGVLERIGGDLVEVFDVGQVAFGVAGNPFGQVLAEFRISRRDE